MAKVVTLLVLYVLVYITSGFVFLSTRVNGEKIDPSTSTPNSGISPTGDVPHDHDIQSTQDPVTVDTTSITTDDSEDGSTNLFSSHLPAEPVDTVSSQTGEETSGMSSTTSPETSDPPTFEISSLFGKTLNFSYLVVFTEGVQLTLATKPVDLSAFIVDMSNADQFDEMLRGRNISEFLYIATKLAGIEAKIADIKNQTITSMALEDLFDPTDDTVLTAEDVDELEREITDDPRKLDLDDTADSNMESRTKRKALSDTSKRWPTTIRYRISSNFNSEYRKAIEDGIKHWEDETCLDFRRVNSFNGSHIFFKKFSGCYSKVGRSSYGQTISIGINCGTKGKVAHEIGHALGFRHEHIRPDRDSYVRIHTANIKTGKLHNLMKREWDEYLTAGIPYDYSSVMHYTLNGFSRNKSTLNTITVKEEDMGAVVGSRIGLSFYDVKLANYLYCQSRCWQGLTWSACMNDGYRDPKSCIRCKCPDGWTGHYCTDVKPGVNASCGTIDLTASTYLRTMKSPNYDTGRYTANSECTWRIKTTGSNKRIRLQFTGTFEFHCSSTCLDYIEVRYKDMAKAGPRYCCSSRPTRQIVSHGNEVLLLMRATSGFRYKGFRLRYKVESCGGCSVAAGMLVVSPCVDTQTYACNQRYSDCSGRSCVTRYRHNTCYREVKTCCSGFELRGNNCVRAWSNWSVWSSCSKTCNSGVRTRRRTCITPPCSGPATASVRCSVNSYCPGQWSNWSSWSNCSKTCGYGTRSRKRTCYKPPCSGSRTNQRTCYSRFCVCSYRARCGGWWNWPRYCTRYRSC